MSGILDSIVIDNLTMTRGENVIQTSLELRNPLTAPKVHFISIRNASILLPEIKDVLKFAKLHTITDNIEKYPFLSHTLSISGFYNIRPVQNSNENFRLSVISIAGESTIVGNMNFKQKSFDGVSYNVAADLSIDPSKLEINSLSIQDDQEGKAKISGKINLSLFKILDFDLRSKIDKLLLLNVQNITLSYPISGKLICSSNNVLLKGTYDKPNLSGSFTIDGFDLSSQNTYSSKLAYNSFNFINFTARENSFSSNKINLSDSIKTYFGILPENKLEEQSNSFLNKLTYDIDITSNQFLKYTHVLDQKFGAELSINVNKLALNLRKSENLLLNGYANINSGNFKYYATNFKLEDGGSVVWVNNKISDGKLSNVRAKKNVSLYNISNSQTENIDIFLKLSDNISNPKLEMGYSISYPNTNETHYFKSIGSSLTGIEDANAESTIFGILLTGQRSIANTSSNGSNGNIKASSIGLNIVSNFIAQQVSRILGNISWIQSFNIGLDNSLTALDFSITGSIPGLDNKWFFTVENRGMPMSGNQRYTYGGKEKLNYAITPNISFDVFHSNQRSTFNLDNLSTDFFGAGKTQFKSFHTIA
ncbi:hypothetical protein CHS0354_000445 [Potamilus streckersoni]|uniref:Translocation and assembly module TamB C-terminal domain-containing protein n=1 Tax=Potamilus streckersoni TaxID=2493646 RepID=A0AAE0W8Y5_9BIVA|nr:hypothetical protein CHS0354_000445 [Potamilus streckersoni]